MEIQKDSEMSSPISEYEESKDRFHSFMKRKRNVSSTDGSDDEINYLDDIIRKLCSKDKSLDIGHDSTLFYELIIHSDFIQIKNELVETFYSELLSKSIRNNILDDIVENFETLENIPHVKKFFVGQLFNVSYLSPTIRNGSLILDYSKEKVWYDINLDNLNSITILPSAYKFLLLNEEFNMSFLNFMIRISKVKRLILTRCNLNGRNVQALFHELKIESLCLSECGTCVNKIIQDNTSGILDNLKELDLSGNPLLNKTLESLRWIPLNCLNISKCIKNSGKFINSIWFAWYFATQINIEGEEGKSNLDILWEEGVLRQTIEILNVSHNDLSKRNLQLILQNQLKELDIRRCLQLNSVNLSDVVFPKTLKVLKAQLNKFYFEDFKVLSGTFLEKLEMDYYEKNNEQQFVYFTYWEPGNQLKNEPCYSDLLSSSLFETLKELTIGLSKFSLELISFISSFKLKYFCCQCLQYNIGNEILSAYICNPNLNSNCLESLKIESYLESTFSIEKEMFSENFKLRNLKELYLHAWKRCGKISSILSAENLQESIECLGLSENYFITDDDAIQILKFKKLKKLSFTFENVISYHNLKNIIEMQTLKELKVSAIICGIVDLNFAQLICLAPIHTLQIIRGSDVTEEALRYLTDEKNSFGMSKHLRTFVSVSSGFKPNLAHVLKRVNWQEILLLSCYWKENSAEIFLSNENLTWSLDYLCLSMHVTRNWKVESFQKLLCTNLQTERRLFQGHQLILKPIPISEFLFSLSFKSLYLKEDLLHLQELVNSNLSIVDYFELDPRLEHYYCYTRLDTGHGFELHW